MRCIDCWFTSCSFLHFCWTIKKENTGKIVKMHFLTIENENDISFKQYFQVPFSARSELSWFSTIHWLNTSSKFVKYKHKKIYVKVHCLLVHIFCFLNFYWFYWTTNLEITGKICRGKKENSRMTISFKYLSNLSLHKWALSSINMQSLYIAFIQVYCLNVKSTE